MVSQLKARLAQRKNSGFTLMELLIVIAIISVLVAIAIPTFSAQLNNAKDAADKANARALYALVQADWMSDSQHSERYAGLGLNEDNKVIVEFDDGSQSFTFSDRTTNVEVFYESNSGAHVRVSSLGNDGAGYEYPEG